MLNVSTKQHLIYTCASSVPSETLAKLMPSQMLGFAPFASNSCSSLAYITKLLLLPFSKTNWETNSCYHRTCIHCTSVHLRWIHTQRTWRHICTELIYGFLFVQKTFRLLFWMWPWTVLSPCNCTEYRDGFSEAQPTVVVERFL